MTLQSCKDYIWKLRLHEISPSLSPEVAMLRRGLPANAANRNRPATSGYIQTEATVQFRRKLARDDFHLKAELARLDREEEEHTQGYDRQIRDLKDLMNQIETRTLPLKDIDLITKRHHHQRQQQQQQRQEHCLSDVDTVDSESCCSSESSRS